MQKCRKGYIGDVKKVQKIWRSGAITAGVSHFGSFLTSEALSLSTFCFRTMPSCTMIAHRLAGLLFARRGICSHFGNRSMSAKNSFDAKAANYDKNEARRLRGKAIAQAVMDNVPLGRSTSLVDYGAGTGLILEHLQPLVSHITAMDNSKGMLNELESKCKQRGFDNVSFLLHDIETDELPDEAFDVIVSGMTMHHMAEPGLFVTKAARALRPYGYLCVADVETEDGTFHDDKTDKTVRHYGFDPLWVEGLLGRNGLCPVFNGRVHEIVKVRGEGTRSYPVFMVIGQKRIEHQ